MGLIDFINSIGKSFMDFASSSSDFKCAQCIKCKQCVKTLSNSEQVRVFTCPAVDPNLADDEYIDSLLPDVINGITPEYIEAYNNNRDTIYSYLYSNPTVYSNLATPLLLKSCTPVTTYDELLYFYKAISCPKFRPFIDTSNIVGYNDNLQTFVAPNIISFDDLPATDKTMITQTEGW